MSLTIMSLHNAQVSYMDYEYVISITDKNSKALRFGSNHIHVRFDDAEHPNSMEISDMQRGVAKILAWVKSKNLTGEEKILVHCHAGISRSAAIAWTLLVMFGEDYFTAYNKLKAARPMIWPNRNVIKFADDLLGLKGEFLQIANEMDFSYQN